MFSHGQVETAVKYNLVIKYPNMKCRWRAMMNAQVVA